MHHLKNEEENVEMTKKKIKDKHIDFKEDRRQYIKFEEDKDYTSQLKKYENILCFYLFLLI